ncbi:hypothetical protein ACQFYA_12690 [Promicromonospora sp. Marseille-Q5078]
MIIEIRLLARLVRIPLLRVEGAVAIRDDDVSTGSGDSGPAGHRTIVLGAGADSRAGRAPAVRAADASPPTAYGRDLAAAETILASLRAPDGGRSG